METSTKIRMLKLEEKELTLKIEDLNKDITDVGLEAAGIQLFEFLCLISFPRCCYATVEIRTEKIDDFSRQFLVE